VILPSEFREDGTPVFIPFAGPLFGEGEILASGMPASRQLAHQLRHPPLFGVRAVPEITPGAGSLRQIASSVSLRRSGQSFD